MQFGRRLPDANVNEVMNTEYCLVNNLREDAGTAPQQRRILVVAKDRHLRQLTTRALLSTGARVHAASSIESGLTSLHEQATDILFADRSNASLIPQAVAMHPRLFTVLLTDQSPFEGEGRAELDLLSTSASVTNILACTEARDPMAVREITVTATKLLTKDIFGLEKYLSWGATIHKERLTNSSHRRAVIQRVSDYAIQGCLKSMTLCNIEILADELLMNAIWDAPLDEEGNPKYANRSRIEPVALLDQEAVTIRYGMDGSFFGLSVIDPFGRFEYETACRNLARCFAKGDDQIVRGNAGAGLGLYMAYNTVSSLVINVLPGKKTEVIGLLNLHQMDSGRGKRAAPSFCYFRAPKRRGNSSIPIASLKKT